jgi:hypothetical protein
MTGNAQAVAAVLVSLLFASPALAEEAAPPRKGAWPIRNGHNSQPTSRELRAMERQDVTPDQAREIDRLYDELMTKRDKARRWYPAPRP